MNPFTFLTNEDQQLACSILGGFRPPDLTIAPDGVPYLYRWHVIPRNHRGNHYLHIQIASDPERPLHDHPWDNTSVILSGYYNERILDRTPLSYRMVEDHASLIVRKPRETVYRRAVWPHRLFLPAEVPYVMTQFTTGPVYRDWGFWKPEGWTSHKDCIEEREGWSVQKGIQIVEDEV